MAFDILVKPVFDGIGGGGVVTSQPGRLVVRGPDGTVLDTVDVGGPRGSEGFKQPVSSIAQGLPPGSTLEFTPQGGQSSVYNITGAGKRHEFQFGRSDPTVVSDKGAIGSAPGGGYPGGFAPGVAGGYGVYPSYLGNMFPSPALVNYDPIEAASYDFVDPMEFAQAFGGFNREELRKNFDLSKEFAFETLAAELQGLEGFVPAASALKRNEVALDNIFNQQQRTQQIDTALPGVRGQLDRQAQRAETFAEGGVPDSISDRALELGVRSEAADIATAGGFGSDSSVARKLSDILSAEQRIGLSQYGDQLLSSNINQRANLLLAPTSYSDAGQQIRVTPEVGAGRLTTQGLSELNANTLISPGAALQAEIGQQQFVTNLRQQTNQFNASNQFAANQLNAGYQNQFALGLFDYQVGFAGAVAGALQTGINTGFALAQQQRYEEIFGDHFNQAQQAGQAGAIAGAITQLPGIIAGINSLLDTFGLNSENTPGINPNPDSGATGVPEGTTDAPTYGNDAIEVPTGDSVPDGYEGVATDSSGGTIAVPDANFKSAYSSFSQDTGIQASTPMTAKAYNASTGVLRSAGFSYTPDPAGSNVPAGVDKAGKPVYVNKTLAQSTDTSAGSRVAGAVKQILDPTGVFSREDATTMDKIIQASKDAALIAQLTAQAQAGDKKGFINTLLGAVKQPTIEAITKDPKSQDGLNTAFTAYQLFSNWDRMSPAQKSISIASLGIQGYKFASGENLAAKHIITPSKGNPGLTVGQGLQLFQAGYNVYSLVDNWDQYNTLSKIAGTTGSAASVANLAQQFGLLGAGTNGAAVAGVTPAVLAQAGATAAPSYGVGAISVASEAALPSGYTAIASEGGKVIGIPSANAGSAAVPNTFAGTLTNIAGGAAIAAGAYQIYKGWGTGGEKGALNGALGGSAMAAGLYTLGATNPFLLGGIVAASALSGLIKTGKHEGQVKRDAVRSRFQDIGLIGKDYNVTLADGSTYDIGVDGRGNMRGDRYAYDVDYENDLAFSAAMGGIALSRLVSGGTATETDQMGGYLGNAAISNISSKEFTPENYNKAMQNMRAMYAQAGVSSKEIAYQLANQAYAEGRIDEFALTQAHQAANMIFDPNSFEMAQRLMSGRNQGVQAAQESSNVNKPDRRRTLDRVRDSYGTVDRRSLASDSNIPSGFRSTKKRVLTKEEIAEINRARYGSQAA